MGRRPRLQFLRFDPPREAVFKAEYAERSLRYMRIAGGLLAVLNVVGLFGTPRTDWLDVLGPLVLALEAVGFLAFTYWQSARRWLQAALVVVALSGLANLVVQAVSTFQSLDPDQASRANWVTTFTLYLAVGLLGLYTLLRLRFWYSAFTGSIATLTWLAWLFYASGAGMLDPDPVVLAATMLIASNLIGLAANYSIESAARRDFEARHQIAAERAKSDRLLYQMLPERVAHQLREGRTTVAESVSVVTVLFADLSGFTPMSVRRPAEQIITLLNQLFGRFDQLARELGVEKIVTIGDAFLAVAGVPAWRADHAEAVAELALQMQTAVAEVNSELNLDLEVRIGINTGGPVVAGVIGTTRYLYTVIGDAVNTASRMESHGLPGRIQVAEATYTCLKEAYVLEERGVIDVKGKGPMRTYFLLGRGPTWPPSSARCGHTRGLRCTHNTA